MKLKFLFCVIFGFFIFSFAGAQDYASERAIVKEYVEYHVEDLIKILEGKQYELTWRGNTGSVVHQTENKIMTLSVTKNPDGTVWYASITSVQFHAGKIGGNATKLFRLMFYDFLSGKGARLVTGDEHSVLFLLNNEYLVSCDALCTDDLILDLTVTRRQK